MWPRSGGDQLNSDARSRIEVTHDHDILEHVQLAPFDWADEDAEKRELITRTDQDGLVKQRQGDPDQNRTWHHDVGIESKFPSGRLHPTADTHADMLAEEKDDTVSAESSMASSSALSRNPSITLPNKSSLPRRSIQSLRYIARAWTSYSPGSTAHAGDALHNDAKARYPPAHANGHSSSADVHKAKRPVHLDRRRLDKAVSLAIEAAQMAEEDERLWRQRKLQQRRMAASAPSSGRSSPRPRVFPSLPWPRMAGQQASQRHESEYGTRRLEESHVSEALTGRYDVEVDITSEEEDDGPDEYSTELYISSLSYLLSALRPEDADLLPKEQREQLSLRLRQALDELEDSAVTGTMTHEEEILMMQIRHELPAEGERRACADSNDKKRLHNAVRDHEQSTSWHTKSHLVSSPKTLAGAVASSALDLGLTAGAGLLAAASRSISVLIPNIDAAGDMVERDQTLDDHGHDAHSRALPASRHITSPEMRRPNVPSNAQWEITRNLASTVASTMYNQLALAARAPGGPGQDDERAIVKSDPDKHAAHTDDPAERLMMISASLARSVKRSPLPTQVRALASQVLALAGAIDRKYNLSQRSADIALRKTGQALSYVRRNDLHVKAIRIAWNVVEASVVAMEAYRDEEGWREPGTRPRSLSLPSSCNERPRLPDAPWTTTHGGEVG